MKVATALFVLALVGAISAWPVEDHNVGGSIVECVKQAVGGITKCLSGENMSAAVSVNIGSVCVSDEFVGDIKECLKTVGEQLAHCLISK